MNVLAADIMERFYTLMWPMLRISALMLTAPILSQHAFNLRMRILLALVLAWMVYPLHRWPLIDPTSAQGLIEVFNQIMIGGMMGLILQVVVAAVVLAGQSVATAMGLMNFDKVGKAAWFDVVLPFQFGMPVFDPVLIVTMTLVMVVVMIESTGMFLALGEMTDRHVDRSALSRGLRTDGLGTLIGGIFNTFPYTSFSQNVGLVAVTGVKSRFVCVAGGIILIVLGVIPKMAALVESLPTVVLGGAGLVMFGMVAATGIRILAGVDFKNNRFNSLIVAISIGIGMIPLIAPNFKQWMPHNLHPLIESGILLASLSAVVLNLFFNGANADDSAAIEAARQADSH